MVRPISAGKSFTLQRMKPLENYSLRNLNTFGLHASARYYASAESLDELQELVEWAKKQQLPLLPLGGGSNILLKDDYPGLVLSINLGGIECLPSGEGKKILRAGAGVEWHDLVLFAIANELGGIENLSLIPGKVGAAPIQNIGAYGVELKDVFHELEALDIAQNKTLRFNASDCRFAYRDSYFKNEGKGRFIITSVSLKLASKGYTPNLSYGGIRQKLDEMGVKDPGIKDVSDTVIRIRREKLPDPSETGNAGSFFKNPEIPVTAFEKLHAAYPDIPHFRLENGMIKIPAAWLIDRSGWKGRKLGRAATHHRQPLVLVNLGGASSAEILNLAARIQKDVEKKFGIALTPEVNII